MQKLTVPSDSGVVETVRILTHLVPVHKSQTAFRIPRQHIIERLQLSHLSSALFTQCSRIRPMNCFCCCASLSPFQRRRACALSTMPFADAFPSSCGEPALNFCSLGSGLTARSFDPTTARDNHLFHKRDYTLISLFYRV